MTKKRDRHLFKLSIGEAEEADQPFEDIFSASFSDSALLKEIEKKERAVAPLQSPDTPAKRFSHPQAVLDLHGETRRKTLAKVPSFIQTCLHRGFHTVRIITGKGLHSPGDAILPETVENTLQELKKTGVIQTWRWETKNRKKRGSVLVFIKNI